MKIKRSIRFLPVLIMLLFNAVSVPASAEDIKSLAWEDCVKAALLNNPDIISSREAVIQKEAQKGVKRAPMLPQVSANVTGKKTSDTDASGSADSKTFSYDLTAKQLIFDGFKSYYDMKGADKDITTAKYDYSVTSAQVRLDLKNAYVSYLKAVEMLKILEDIQSRRKHIMELVKLKYEGGKEHRGSFYSARADYLQSQADVKSALREVSLSRTKLCYLTGLKESEQFTIKGELVLDTLYDEKPDFSVLALKNPSYLKSVSASESALYSVESSKRAFMPELYGTASAGRSGESYERMNGNWSLGFSVTAPLFEGGSTWYTYSKNESAYRQARSDEKSVKNSVMKSLEASWNSLRDSIEKVEVQKAALDAVVERSKIGESQYSIGTLTFDNWTIIESSLASTKKSYYEACASALTAEAQWIQSKGGTLENEK